MIMIPVKITDVERQVMINNVVATFRDATPEQLEAGRSWYWQAHELAGEIGHGDRVMGAGVIAALSANKSWAENGRLARLACRTGRPVGHVQDAIVKAAKIISGTDPWDVLPMERKTGHFYRCIVNPTDPDAVCVDRHAHDVAVGEVYGDRDRGLTAKGRYAALAGVYRAAGSILGVLPQEVQAVTWVVHTQRLAGTSTRTKEHAA
jgi:hypothetical protein